MAKRGIPLDRKVPLVKPQTAASSRTVKSTRTKISTSLEHPDQNEVLKMVTKRELVNLVGNLEKLRRENDLLLQGQEAKFGVTVDNAEALKHELAKAKAINNGLLEEITLGKEKCEKLYEDFVLLQEKFEACERQLKKYRREKKSWDDTKDKLRIAEDRCRRLIIKNKDLKMLLLKHSIKPEPKCLDSSLKTDSQHILKKSKIIKKVQDTRKNTKTMRWI